MATQTSTIRVVADTTQAERALGSLGSSLRNLAAIGAVGAIAKQFTDLADSATILSNKMKTVTNSSADAGIAFSNVIAIAKQTGMEVGAVGDLFQKVSLAGQQLGLSVADTTKITENFTKALAVTGTVGPAATSAIYQFGQSLGRGTVMFEDMKQLQESSAGTLELIAKQFGKTSQQFLKDVQASKVGSRDLAAALGQLGQSVDGDFGKMRKTIGQSLNSVGASFVELMQKFEDATGTFDKLAKGIAWLGDNLGIAVPLAAALVGAFAAARLAAIISSIAQMVIAIRTLGTTAAVASALATGGLSAIAAAAGATAAYLAADKLFGDLEKNAALKKQADEAKRLSEEADKAGKKISTIKYQGPQLDMQALGESATAFTLQARLMTQLAGYGKMRQEQEKAVADFAKEQKVTYEQIAKTNIANQIRGDIAARQTAEAMASANSELLTQKAQALAYTKLDTLEAIKVMTADKLRLQYENSISDATKQIIIDNTVLAKLKEDAYRLDMDSKNVQKSFMDYASNMVMLTAHELDTRQKILDIETQFGYELDKGTENQILKTEATRKQLEYLKQMKSAVEAVNSPLGGAAAGASVAGQLGQLDPIKQAETANKTMFEGLQYLRDSDLISHEQYERAKLNASVQAQDAIMDATRKQYEAAAQQRIQSTSGSVFGYETQKQMAKDAAAFQMKTEVEKTQFVLAEAANSLNIMGQQNKKAFEAAKAFNIANALMNTFMGATKAIATYGFPLGPIFAALTIGAGMAQVAAIRSQQYSGRALGGPVMGGQSYIVGESGPELFTPNTTGSITRNGDLGGNGAVNVNFSISAVDASSFDGLLVQRRGLITQIISDAMVEKGQRGI